MSEAEKNCDLCQLPIGTAQYVLRTQIGTKHFCCEGCQGIYRMLHESEILEDPVQQ